ncbi:bifunctional [glutamine synthetase] adenylyltransferase/[glutamine synthetase]-adenylyl-L-tyrosine phosphorylase [Roseomonas sp. HJA6]|uniref:Bifunctional glutamine synthetase adenylyltransferase/adenylyl-removing enzyme n=1 Tax=Roseomonas alba TaxID=2846776 RepID=A0ABS7A2C3_9PROT|nr:bifunctional [glutamine synthetase] adenylyltransferase/[glutamine synthetase]-adenylyl-L-tyrosine phosphorylase [Neoroseomonas alba]MBW6396457.1 bifunctional [glutamine synthetase] adenylyltransferase/[glutamine synthetase]-adenylyl-L-tyrosine phosphorylase [Neoroseomonas alba]
MTACFAPERLPHPFDPDAARLMRENFAERGEAERDFAASGPGRALLDALGGHSPYLADLAIRESAALLAIAQDGPDEAFARALDPLTRIDPETPRAAVATVLRQAKRQGALAAAVGDITGLWPLDRVTGALSDLAEASIDAACAHLLRDAAARGELRVTGAARTEPRLVGRNSGLVVLGMGKLGGRELNYSSDVDLMVLYDPAAAYHADRAGAVYVRIARDLVRLLEERTAEGYVFRTDLRLRPDPAATPLAVSIPAAITYYESMGQNWERAAMIKARPVAADRAAGEAFLREIRPFVWRRHLDFAAVADIHSIKRQIHAHKGAKGAHDTVQVEGHDVKLGRGGIREIEFTVQVLQLIWGGRDPGLRDPTTLGALSSLASAGKIDRRAAADLADAYVFLRTLEHRLQMVADRQTHRMPEDAQGIANIASFLGFPDVEAFRRVFTEHLRKVERHYGRMFEAEPTLAAEDVRGSLVFTGVEDDPATIATLRAMGYANPSAVAALVRGWHHGHTRATRSERARELLTALMPGLLAAFAKQRDPDTALARLDGVFGRLAAGVQVLSLLARNPALLDRLAAILGAAPQLADHLASHTAALEGLLVGAGGTVGNAATTLPAQLKDARHIEEAMDAARRLVLEGKFEIDAAALEGLIDIDAAGEARSALADAAIIGLLPHIQAEFAERYGKVKGGGLAVVALGKLGGREMLPGSDLDLILIYDHAAGVEASEGRPRRGHPAPRPLPVSQYFTRLAHQVIGGITAPGPGGKLYEVDMRLRPSGSKGPVAVSLSGFQRYHAEDAWTWERMALTRARVVSATPALKRKVEAAIRTALLRPDVADKAIPDAVAMRARMLRDLPPDGPWDVKLGRGGLVEVEFIAQALQLAHAKRHPEALATTTRVAIARLAKAGLLDPAEAETLIAAEHLWRTISGLLRLTVGRWREEALPESLVAPLLHACRGLNPATPLVDLAGLKAQMASRAKAVRAVFERRLGRPETNGDAK